MRWVLACMVAFAGVASAHVVRVPTVARECGEEPAWKDVAACAAKFGAVKIERTLPHARLVRITNPTDGIRGIYLFVEAGTKWRLGGLYEDDVAVLGLDTVTFDGHPVYRIEIGMSNQFAVSLDGRTTTRTMFVEHEQVYCTGTSYRCTSVRTSCDALVAGKAQLTFRGTVTWKDGALLVAGDRSHAGKFCDEREVAPLLFPDQ